jgi:Bacterial Ig-like domain (group 1)
MADRYFEGVLYMRYFVLSAAVCLVALALASSSTAQTAGVLPGQWLLSIASNGDRFDFQLDCQPDVSTIEFAVAGAAIPISGGYSGTFEEQGSVVLDATGHVVGFSSTFTIRADDGTVVTGTKELDTSETAGIATGACTVDSSGACYVHTSPIDLRYTALTPSGTETGTAFTRGVDGYQAICGGATDGAFEEEFLATDQAPSEPTTLTLEPASAVNSVDEPHTVTATLLDQYGSPIQDYSIRFSVTGATTADGSCITDVLGRCTFTFAGATFPGPATITACTDAFGDGSCEPQPTATATKSYVLPQSTTGSTSGGGRIGTTTVFVSVRSTSTGLSGDCLINTGDTTVDCLSATSYVQAGTNSTTYGLATVNGIETPYRIRVVDNGNSDLFSITTESGYQLTGALTSGNLRVH